MRSGHDMEHLGTRRRNNACRRRSRSQNHSERFLHPIRGPGRSRMLGLDFFA